MISDDLIYDEFKRRGERSWEPVPLQLPLSLPIRPGRVEEDDDEGDDDARPVRGVLIIDMIDYNEIEI